MTKNVVDARTVVKMRYGWPIFALKELRRTPRWGSGAYNSERKPILPTVYSISQRGKIEIFSIWKLRIANVQIIRGYGVQTR